MRPFTYVRAHEVGTALAEAEADSRADFLAGGTTQLDLMKDGVLRPDRLIDITRLPLHGIEERQGALIVGALVTMEELAADPVAGRRLPLVREALLRSASVQLRNMATIGGNLLQRTRCRYFRDPTVAACNKRDRGSGCAAVHGSHRTHAVLGTSEHCIATHASDVAVTLVALDAVVHISGAAGDRKVPLTGFYRTPGDTPDVENDLRPGELIAAVEIPLLPEGARSDYLKVRDRSSYEFALASAAVAVGLGADRRIEWARVGLGGVATVPWRAVEAEAVLTGSPADGEVFASAAAAAVAGAEPRPQNAFKVDLAQRTLVRTLQTVTGAGS
ncbi:FAD binding domain-containing protein [Actinacidiphila acidipaludis]|uniref:Xanthine dehydrogenase family protein subunit M n=1 Tax=Actinacidiphila acidipaludis TaxID=2873382 RepID=A0ABS7Q943_9ACTN|nr:xanthine dehydrogenase family protein subunit M [Streptomyces acidipaludis]MBY8879673.1 xanthine dehydrogenase family protein subunit M [Streptomyces acidipaludis]